MIVYESLRRRGRALLEAVVESSLQVPYKAMVVVDDGRDGSGKFIAGILGDHGVEVVILRSKVPEGGRPTRAVARQTAIDYFLEETKADWLFFIDDDAVLRKGWWEEARRHLSDERVGLVWGIDWPPHVPPGREGEVRERKVRAFKLRGGLHDTLLRRGALASVPPIPHELHVMEDAWIYWAMTCRGWEARIVEAGATHYGGDYPFISAGPRGVMEAYRLLGIVEDYRPRARRDYSNPFIPFLLIARPILGFLAGLPGALREGSLRRHARVQWNKLRQRYYAALARLKYGPPRHPCDAFRNAGDTGRA